MTRSMQARNCVYFIELMTNQRGRQSDFPGIFLTFLLNIPLAQIVGAMPDGRQCRNASRLLPVRPPGARQVGLVRNAPIPRPNAPQHGCWLLGSNPRPASILFPGHRKSRKDTGSNHPRRFCPGRRPTPMEHRQRRTLGTCQEGATNGQHTRQGRRVFATVQDDPARTPRQYHRSTQAHLIESKT